MEKTKMDLSDEVVEVVNNEIEMELEKKEENLGPWKIFWKRFRKNKMAMVGVVLFSILILGAIFAPLLTPYGPNDIGVGGKYDAPTMEHWLGTDILGRDYLTRLLYGGRISLSVGVFSAGVAVVFGVVVGGVAGYFGGWVDDLLMRIAEVVYSFPFMPLMITLSFVLQGMGVSSDLKVYLIMLLIGFLSWPGLARLIRTQIMSLREQEFIQAADALGVSNTKKIFKHLIPNVISIIIVYATLRMASAILVESMLSYLGLGVQPPVPTWGNMINAAREVYTLKYRLWIWIPPGVCIFIAVMSINLIGEGLQDAFDPKSDRR